MAEAFDGYYKWLGIPPDEQPPNYYRLLAIRLFEPDSEVIASAADRQMAHVRSFQAGRYSALSQQILNEIATARVCLLNLEKRVAYDASLEERLAAVAGGPSGHAYAGFDVTDLGPAGPVARPRPSGPRKLPWQLPAAIGGALIGCVVVWVYLAATGPPRDQETRLEAKTESPAPPKNNVADTSPKPKPKPPKPKPKPPEPEPEPEPKPPEPEPKPPEPKPDVPPPKPVPVVAPPVVESPEQAEARLKAAVAGAKSQAEYKTVAENALKAADQAAADNKPELVKRIAAVALSAARRAGDEDLIAAATLRFIEPGSARAVKPSTP